MPLSKYELIGKNYSRESLKGSMLWSSLKRFETLDKSNKMESAFAKEQNILGTSVLYYKVIKCMRGTAYITQE
jgi:hypothetical protein